MDIIPYPVLLAGLADGESEFQGGDSLDILQERLMSDVPCKGARWEESPSVRRRELAGAVPAGCEREDISGINRVVHTSVERHQEVLVPIHQVP